MPEASLDAKQGLPCRNQPSLIPKGEMGQDKGRSGRPLPAPSLPARLCCRLCLKQICLPTFGCRAVWGLRWKFQSPGVDGPAVGMVGRAQNSRVAPAPAGSRTRRPLKANRSWANRRQNGSRLESASLFCL